MLKILDFKGLLNNSDGIILASPEWAGSSTPILMNAIQLAGSSLAYKPGLIVTTSASRGGTYPVAEIRSFGYKNSKINFIPDHLIVRKVEEVLNPLATDQEITKTDKYIRDRTDWTIDVFIEYIIT